MKNLNSFKAIARAIENERERQIDLIEAGEAVIQETRRWMIQRNILMLCVQKKMLRITDISLILTLFQLSLVTNGWLKLSQKNLNLEMKDGKIYFRI